MKNGNEIETKILLQNWQRMKLKTYLRANQKTINIIETKNTIADTNSIDILHFWLSKPQGGSPFGGIEKPDSLVILHIMLYLFLGNRRSSYQSKIAKTKTFNLVLLAHLSGCWVQNPPLFRIWCHISRRLPLLRAYWCPQNLHFCRLLPKSN